MLDRGQGRNLSGEVEPDSKARYDARPNVDLAVSRQKRFHPIDESGRVVDRDVVIAVRNFSQLDVPATRLDLGVDLRADALAAVALHQQRRN